MKTALSKKINKYSLQKAAIAILALLLSSAIYDILWQQKQTDEMTVGYEMNKEILSNECNEMYLQYEGFKYSVSNNDSLVMLLTKEQGKIHRLQEELRTVKATDVSRINELKKELETLRSTISHYIAQSDIE